MKYIIIVILLCLFLRIQSRSFFYSGSLQKTSYYQCYKQNGFTRVGLILYYSADGVDEEYTQNFYNALSAGLTVETIIVPYRCRTVDEEIEFMKTNIKLNFIDKFWILVGSELQDCSWDQFTPQENCQWLIELMIKMRSLNLSLGIFTKLDIWSSTFLNQIGCPELNHLPLWWISLDQQADYEQNFNSYHQIGGWKAPYMKVLQQATICGQELLQNYYI